jgi:hypothetical protein
MLLGQSPHLQDLRHLVTQSIYAQPALTRLRYRSLTCLPEKSDCLLNDVCASRRVSASGGEDEDHNLVEEDFGISRNFALDLYKSAS